MSEGCDGDRRALKVYVRYSARCKAAWGRIWHGDMAGRVSISTGGAPTQSATVADISETTDFVYTMMVPATASGAGLNVCWTPPQGAPTCHAVAVP